MSTVIEQPKQQSTIRDRLKSQGMIAEMQKAMPKHCSGERMARIALTALTKTPKLAECTEASFFKCLLDLSQWGLEPDGRRAYLIPYGKEATLIISYMGYVELCYRSGVVKSIHADLVHEGDIFIYNTGEVVKHVPYFLRVDADKPKSEGKVYAAYCKVELAMGATKTEVMGVDDIERIRKCSKSPNSGPWVQHWGEMAKKTVFRRCQKWLPVSAEILDAMEADDDKSEPIEAVATRVQTIDELQNLIAAEPERGDAAED